MSENKPASLVEQLKHTFKFLFHRHSAADHQRLREFSTAFDEIKVEHDAKTASNPCPKPPDA